MRKGLSVDVFPPFKEKRDTGLRLNLIVTHFSLPPVSPFRHGPAIEHAQRLTRKNVWYGCERRGAGCVPAHFSFSLFHTIPGPQDRVLIQAHGPAVGWWGCCESKKEALSNAMPSRLSPTHTWKKPLALWGNKEPRCPIKNQNLLIMPRAS